MPYTLVSQFGYDTLAEHLRIDQDLQARYTDAEEMDEYPEISCFGPETAIALPRKHGTIDGMAITDVSHQTIGQLAKDYEEGRHRTLLVYAFDHEAGRVVVAEAKGPVKTGRRQVYRVTYEEYRGEERRTWSIKATYDHLFMLRDGSYRATIDLESGDRLMPCTFKVDSNGYLVVYEPMKVTSGGKATYRAVHGLVAEALCGRALTGDEVVHHLNGDKTDPSPSNLDIVRRGDHVRTHLADVVAETDRRRSIAEAVTDQWSDPAYKLRLSKVHASGRSDWLKSGRPSKGILSAEHRAAIGRAHAIPLARDVVEAALRASASVNDAAKKLGVSWNTMGRRMAQYGIDRDILGTNLSGPQPQDDEYLNHRVVSVERLGEEDVYDLEVPGYRNFAVGDGGDGFVFAHNCALDIYADDATMPDLDKEQSIWVTSGDKQVADELNDVLHKRLLVEDDIWGNVRTLCKYGSTFGELLVSDAGLVGINYLPPPTVRRVESPRGQLLGFIQDIRGEFNISLEDFYTLAQQRGEGAEVIRGRAPGELSVFEDWELVHWRLRGKHLRSVYGHGIIDPARYIWKRLSLLEDALLIYKLERAPSRYAFYIDVGELDAERGLAHVNRVKNAFTRKKFVNNSTGKLDMRYNPLCLHGDTRVRLLDGSVRTIEEMVEAHASGETQWVWSVDLEDEGKLRPGKVEWAGKTRLDAQLVRVTLDNGESVVVTPDHGMIRRDCSEVQAQQLQPGDSLMPFRRRISEVVSVEWLEERADTFTLTVGETHTFALFAGIFVKNSHDEDFFVPVRGGKRTTEIEVIQGPDYSEVESLEYHRDKLVSALKIPKSYMGYGGDAAPRALSTEDVRFARTVMRIQRVERGGYRKALRVHLIARGADVDKADFDVRMSVPSQILELARMEVMNTTADLASRMREMVSTRWVLVHLFKFSEDEAARVMKEGDDEILKRGQIDAQVQMLQQAAMGGGMGGPAAPGAEVGAEAGGGGEAGAGEEGGVVASTNRAAVSGGAPELVEMRQMEQRLARLIKATPRYDWRREFENGTRASERRAEDKLDRLLRENGNIAKRLRETGGLLTEIRRSMRDAQGIGS